MSADARGRLIEDPFGWRVLGSGAIVVSRGGRDVTTVAGRKAERLGAALEAAGETEAQHLLARATGNYRRGNERR
jgi:hypothetical protein